MNKLWTEAYRPSVIEDCILPDSIKSAFKQFVKDKYVPNLLLSGGPGIGKTTVAKAVLDECGFDWIVVNGSMDGNIDTLRTTIRNFASTVSFTGARKYVILDEADYLNPQSTQPALRNFMEEFSSNCGFIMTCNFKNRIIEPLHSRTSVIDFKINGKEKTEMAKQMMTRLEYVLTTEGVKYEKKVLGQMLLKHFGDWRRIINELQRYASSGAIDTGILVNMSDESYKQLLKALKEKNFKDMRGWVGKNSDIDSVEIFRKLYDFSADVLTSNAVPQLVLILADYSYKSAFVADQEINLVACLTEIMGSCEFK
jgi:DNA polymerase III delta prime subunit